MDKMERGEISERCNGLDKEVFRLNNQREKLNESAEQQTNGRRKNMKKRIISLLLCLGRNIIDSKLAIHIRNCSHSSPFH